MRTHTLTRPVPPASVLHGTGASVTYGYNVMDPYDRLVWRAKSHVTLKEIAPVTKQAVVCLVNGEPVLPADWEVVELCDDDHATFKILPKGGGGGGSLQTVLGIVLIVVGVIFEQPYLIGAGAAMLASGLVSPPSMVPLTGQTNQEAPSPTYNIQLSGNSARLGQPIPVVYGRHIVMPDFAAAPYQEFGDNDDQYYHALLSFGAMDKFTLEQIAIDDTTLDHFTDFQKQIIGPQYPGEVLTLVNPAVVTAPEVAGQELLAGTPVGPFASTGAGMRVVEIGIDIVCPKGLYFANDSGGLAPKSVSFYTEARKITDRGTLDGDWFALGGLETITASQNSPVRRSFKYPVPAGRYEVRCQRTDTKDTNARAGHDAQWAGLRSYTNPDVPLDPNSNFLALRIKANNQLSGLSQRRISMVVRRWLPTWNPDTGWSDPEETCSIAWAFADILKNPVYSIGLPDNRIDLQSLYELDQIWKDRGDEFNGIFDKRITVWQALQAVARVGRARPVMRGSVFTIVRDEKQELPTAMFSMRNIQRGSFTADYVFVSEDDVDGVEVSFFNQEFWATDYVRIPEDCLHPAQVSYPGITHEFHAKREAAYLWADIQFRPNSLQFKTEMEGYLPAFGDLIAVQHDITGWGTSGDIEQWNGDEAILTEFVNWTVGDHYILMINEQGDPVGPLLVVPGSQPRSVQFVDELPGDFQIYTGTERERTRFTFGPANSYAKLCRVVALIPQANDIVQVRAVIEDNRVHSADLPYQDGGTGNGGGQLGRIARYAPDGMAVYDETSDADREAYGFYSTPENTVGSTNDTGYTYVADPA